MATRAALSLEENWETAKPVDTGPVDVIDMFSGCGGMSAGFVAFNGVFPTFSLRAAVDINRVANRTYQFNLGVTPAFENVADLCRSKARLDELITDSRRPGHPLVLIGCAPCQGFSSHRNSAGRADERNSLFLDFARIAAKVRPEVLVVENVPELLTDGYWGYVTRAQTILKRAGYRVHVAVHNTAEFGVPQQRFRALLLATRYGVRPLQPPLRDLPFRSVREAIGHLPPIEAGERCADDPMHYTAAHRLSTLETIRAVPRDGGSRPANVGPDCLRRIHQRQGKAAYEDVYGRLWWDRPAITITAYSRNPASGRFVHPDQDRALSVREAALLQGFPSTYHFEGTLDQRFQQIGNAVPPIFAAYLAGHVLGELLAPSGLGSESRGITAPVGPSFSRMIPGLKAANTRRKQAVEK